MMFKGEYLISRLFNNVKKLRQAFMEMGIQFISSDNQIISIRTGDENSTYRFTNALLENNVWVQKYIHPAAPVGKAFIRLTSMSAHSDSHINKTIHAFKNSLGLIPNHQI
ncbi:MAG: aminotransferase class I/II-fold pyridoxal phosphate-dependent enzyme [bacterium]|nr:aminotransferase class I/II-fold pyridoxal phosphate-dependent enzyme [bacterium]